MSSILPPGELHHTRSPSTTMYTSPSMTTNPPEEPGLGAGGGIGFLGGGGGGGGGSASLATSVVFPLGICALLYDRRSKESEKERQKFTNCGSGGSPIDTEPDTRYCVMSVMSGGRVSTT